MKLSIIVATRNRAAFLGPCLISLCEQTLDPSDYEICVVNNACTDTTPQIVAAVAAHYAKHRLILVDEPQAGVSHARNTGLAATTAPLVACMDDDATAPSDWAARYIEHFENLGQALGKVGGEIVPVWGAPRPHWLTDGMLPLLSAATGRELKAQFTGETLLEGNCCYRRQALQDVGGFARGLGRSGGQLLSAEQVIDIVLFLKGWKLYYDPAILINHTIHADRLTPRWLRQRYFWQGASDHAARIYLHGMGVTGLDQQKVDIHLPLDVADWHFLNDNDAPPTENELNRLRHLGMALAVSGILPVIGGAA